MTARASLFCLALLILAPFINAEDELSKIKEEEKKQKDAAAAGIMLYIGFLALLEMDAQLQWQRRYRACDPEPFAWYPLERASQLFSFLVNSIVNWMLDIMRWILNFLLSLPMFHDLANMILRVYAPINAIAMILVDIVTEIATGEPYFIPRLKQPECYVHCSSEKCFYV